MAAARIRLGVLGCAAIASRFLPRLVAHPAVEVVAIASRDRNRAAELAATVSPGPAPGIAAVEGYDVPLGMPDVDAVYLCLPTGLHAEWALRALDAGKHVLVEKPMATGYAEAEAMTARAAAAGRQLWENRMFAWHGQHDRIRQLVRSGAIGDVRTVHSAMAIPPQPANSYRYSRALGGGALLDVGFYAVHGALPFLGTDTEVVGATLTYADAPDPVDVGGAALLADGVGVLGQLTFGFRHAYRSYYELWGSEGRLTVERAFTPPPDFLPEVTLHRGGHSERLDLPPEDQFGAFLTAFAAAVTGRGDHPAQAATALRGARLLDAIRTRAALAVPSSSRVPLEVS